MGMTHLESAILREARTVTKLPTLRQKDIQEWSSGEIKPQDGETTFRLPEIGVYIAIKTELLTPRPKTPKPKKG